MIEEIFESVKEPSYEIRGLRKETEWSCRMNSSLGLVHSVKLVCC